MKKNIDLVKKFSLLVWTIAVFAYFFQFPFSFLSKLIIPCLGIYLVFNIQNVKIEPKIFVLLITFFIYLAFSTVISLINGTELSRIVRFLFILLAIIYCSILHIIDFKREVDIFLNVAMLKAFLIIILATVIIVMGDYSIFRNWAFENNYGDIYFLNRLFPKVQVHGNALLVMAFIVEYVRNKKINFRGGILLFGILYAGNFAFFVGVALFVLYEVIKKVIPLLRKDKKILGVMISCCFLLYIVVMPYLLKQIEQKSEISNKTRLEQAEVLLDANIFLGEGLGNYIKESTITREYDGDIYFELQTLYIINQIGISGLLIFYTIIFLSIKKYGLNKIVIYSIYLIYTFWNPYCFDTTQMIVTLLIINLIEKGEDNEDSNCNGVLSK